MPVLGALLSKVFRSKNNKQKRNLKWLGNIDLLVTSSIYYWLGRERDSTRTFQFCRQKFRSRVARNGDQTNKGVQVRMHLSSFIHLNTVGTNKGWDNKVNKKKTRTWASEHRKNFSMVMFANERRVANINARDISILVLPGSEEKRQRKKNKGRRTEGRGQRDVWGRATWQSAVCGRRRAYGRRVVLPPLFGIALSVPTVAGRAGEDCRLHEPWQVQQTEEVRVVRTCDPPPSWNIGQGQS